MNIILLGAPGSGKGTQAERIAKKFNIQHISTGKILRSKQLKSAMNTQLKNNLENGNLIPDNLIIKVVKERIIQADCKNGFILDGVPRTLNQANALDHFGMNFDFVIEIDLNDDSEIIERISGRRVHAVSGRTYHIKNKPPKVPGKDDYTGDFLIQRDDDKKEVIEKRLATYYKQTRPVIDYYQNLVKKDILCSKPIYIKIDGSQSINVVTSNILQSLSPC